MRAIHALMLLFALACGSLAAQPAQPAIIWDPSPNYTSGRSGTTIDSIVIHTTEGSYAGAVSWLKNPSAGASAHYVIKEDGSEIKQLVANSNQAWHATYYNSRSIGIECAGFANQASTWTQGILPKLYDLVAWLCYTYNVQAVHPSGTAGSSSAQPYTGVGLVGHYQIQPWNRSDPGPHFDWNAFVAQVNARLNPGGSNDVIVDNVDSGFKVNSGSWSTGSSAAGRYGTDYRFAGTTTGSASAECEWRPNIVTTGTYEVSVYYPAGTNRAIDAPFSVSHANGTSSYAVNQQINGGGWVVLGTHPFFSGTRHAVFLRNNASPSVVLADAVRFRFISAAPAASAPGGLSATALSPTSIRFDWNWATWADGYWLDLATSPADLTSQTGSFQNFNAGASNTYTWNGLAPNTAYYWRVYAVNTQGGNHGFPTPASVTTPPNSGSAPVISSLSPDPVALNALLTINGTNLLGATVTVGGQAQVLTSSSATQLVMPLHPATPLGTQAVVVSTSQGTAGSSLTVAAPAAGLPAVNGVNPDPVRRTELLTISGTDLSGASVTIGGAAQTVVAGPNTITLNVAPATPLGTGQLLAVTTGAGTAYASVDVLPAPGGASGASDTGGSCSTAEGRSLSGLGIALLLALALRRKVRKAP